MQVWFLGQEDSLEEGMASHSSTLAWRIPWTEEPGGPQSMGSQRVGHGWVTSTFTFMLFQVLITSPLEISVQISPRLILQISRLLWGSFISYLHSHNLPQENFQKWSKEISLQELKLSKALHSLQSKCLYNHSKFLLILRGNCVPSGFHDFSHCSLNLNCPRINFILDKIIVSTLCTNTALWISLLYSPRETCSEF